MSWKDWFIVLGVLTLFFATAGLWFPLEVGEDVDDPKDCETAGLGMQNRAVSVHANERVESKCVTWTEDGQDQQWCCAKIQL